MNKHKKNKSKGHSLGERHKFYKTIMWHKFGDHNHIAKSAIFLNTWLTFTKNPYKMLEKLKDHMNLTSIINL
jgi:hypothetical protein